MVTLSDYVVLGILEVFAILVLAVFALMVYNHKLHKRRSSLATQMHQLKDTTRFLLDKVNDFGKMSYALFLNEEVGPAKDRVNQFFAEEELHFDKAQSCEDKAAIMRYLMLEAELAAEAVLDEEAKQALRTGKMSEIVHDFENANRAKTGVDNDAPQTPIASDVAPNDVEINLREKWGYLCDAALNLIKQRTFRAEDDLIEIIRVINQDLALQQLQVPDREKIISSNNQTLELVRQEADRNKEVIAKLLDERDTAEAEVHIKTEALENLQRFIKDSDLCLGLMESELLESQKTIKKAKLAGDHDPAEMQELIQRFSHESREMLLCIETLEKENAELKQQLGMG